MLGPELHEPTLAQRLQVELCSETPRLGSSGPGTGVARVVRAGSPWLFGIQATRRSRETWDIIRTHIVVAKGGSNAGNGVIESVGSKLPTASKKVQAAFVFSCGSIPRVHNSEN